MDSILGRVDAGAIDNPEIFCPLLDRDRLLHRLPQSASHFFVLPLLSTLSPLGPGRHSRMCKGTVGCDEAFRQSYLWKTTTRTCQGAKQAETSTADCSAHRSSGKEGECTIYPHHLHSGDDDNDKPCIICGYG